MKTSQYERSHGYIFLLCSFSNFLSFYLSPPSFFYCLSRQLNVLHNPFSVFISFFLKKGYLCIFLESWVTFWNLLEGSFLFCHTIPRVEPFIHTPFLEHTYRRDCLRKGKLFSDHSLDQFQPRSPVSPPYSGLMSWPFLDSSRVEVYSYFSSAVKPV